MGHFGDASGRPLTSLRSARHLATGRAATAPGIFGRSRAQPRATVVAMGSAAPGLFAYQLNGKLYPSALHNGTATCVAAEGALGGLPSRPATPGDIIQLCANGAGPTNPRPPAGVVIDRIYPLADPSKVSVTLGGKEAAVLGVALTYAGLCQINIRIPDGVAAGDRAITLRVDGQESQANALLTIGPS